MQARSWLIGAAAAVALLMAFAVTSASANRLSISGGRLWRAVWRELGYSSGGVRGVVCEVTLEGSFHSGTIRKVERALIGHITRASVGRCPTGTSTLLTETLPWHVQYLGFEGRLPAITGVHLILIGVALRLREAVFGRTCLKRTTEAEPAGVIAQLGTMEAAGNILVESFRWDETRTIACGELGRISYEGTATVAEVSTGARLLVRLI